MEATPTAMRRRSFWLLPLDCCHHCWGHQQQISALYWDRATHRNPAVVHPQTKKKQREAQAGQHMYRTSEVKGPMLCHLLLACLLFLNHLGFFGRIGKVNEPQHHEVVLAHPMHIPGGNWGFCCEDALLCLRYTVELRYILLTMKCRHFKVIEVSCGAVCFWKNDLWTLRGFLC
ncbi:unnamed protein product [Discosporangium mesarthrocarpum]